MRFMRLVLLLVHLNVLQCHCPMPRVRINTVGKLFLIGKYTSPTKISWQPVAPCLTLPLGRLYSTVSKHEPTCNGNYQSHSPYSHYSNASIQTSLFKTLPFISLCVIFQTLALTSLCHLQNAIVSMLFKCFPASYTLVDYLFIANHSSPCDRHHSICPGILIQRLECRQRQPYLTGQESLPKCTYLFCTEIISMLRRCH